MKQSRLLDELRRQANTAKSKVDWSIALCKMAIYVARQGDEALALSNIREIRKHYGDELHHEVASWVMLSEGVIHFSKGEMKLAFERIRRAHALSGALRTQSVSGLCSAWMALISFNAAKYEEMVGHITDAFNRCNDQDHQALARASLVLADAFQLAGSFDLAKPWYERARRHATIEGDQATLSAYLYNVAVFRAANLRLAHAFDEVDAAQLQRATTEARSSFTYDMLMGSFAFGTFWKILHAQILNIRGDYSESIVLLSSIVEADIADKDLSVFHADFAYALWMNGQFADSVRHQARAEESLPKLLEADDSAYVLKRLSDLASLAERSERCEELLRQAKACLERHKAMQRELLLKLQTIHP